MSAPAWMHPEVTCEICLSPTCPGGDDCHLLKHLADTGVPESSKWREGFLLGYRRGHVARDWIEARKSMGPKDSESRFTELCRNLTDRAATAETLPAAKVDEVRVTSDSGGAKGSKPAKFDLIPSVPLWELAEHFGAGSEKYERVNGLDNWRNGYPWSLSFAAMQRHAWSFWRGEDIDPETGHKHLIAVAWHALVLAEWMEKHPEYDDRQDPRS